MALEEEIVIPQMLGSEKLNTLLVAALKVGADKQGKPFSEVSDMAKISTDNISRNYKFFVSLGVAESAEKGNFKLSQLGTQYSQALDWGKKEDANKVLREMLQDKALTRKAVGYVEMHQPLTKDDLIGQVALFAGLSKERRFVTGINGFLDWLLSSGLIQENPEGLITKSNVELPAKIAEVKAKANTISPEAPPTPLSVIKKQDSAFPLTINLNISESVDEQKLKRILEIIKEFSKS